MNRNNVIGILLILAILVGYSLWMAPSREEIEKQRQEQDSLLRVQQYQDSIANILAEPAVTPDQDQPIADTSTRTVADSTMVTKDLQAAYGAFAVNAVGEERPFTIETELLRLSFSNKGGRITSVELRKFDTWDSLPLVLFTPDSSAFNYSFFSANRLINSQDLYFSVFKDGLPFDSVSLLSLSGTDSTRIAFRIYPQAQASGADAPYMELSYLVRAAEYMQDHEVVFHRMSPYLDSRVNYLTLDWAADLKQQEKSLTNEKSTTTVYYKHLGEEVEHLSERSDDAESIKTKLRWVGFKQQFFASVLIAEESFLNADMSISEEQGMGERYLKSARSTMTIELTNADAERIGLSMYFGPTRFKRLKSYGVELEEMIPLGWGILSWINMFIVIPVFDYLESRIGNYGIIILILTILLKIVLFPIAYRTYMSSAKMRVLRPEVEEIGKKFPDQKDAMKKQQATMDLYRKAGVNPMAGCVPMLLQLPILIALFRFFPASIELRQQSFLWATDLSTYDSVLDLPFNIPFYGDHVSLFTLLMTISTIIYTYLNNQMMATSNQLPGMKTMMYIMPVMFLGFFNSYASGLSYYYLLANLITFLQMFIFQKVVDEDKLRARIEANKKKPRKKSGFQRRLEEMQKQQQAQQKSRRR